MDELISRNALLTNTDTYEPVKYCPEFGHVVQVCNIVYAPTVDAVEVVRCKDCEYLSQNKIAPNWERICKKYGVGKSDDGFCDEAERKERIEE